ncbi:MAG: cation:proton antiporter, partial [Thermodesulfovibrionales bacterium]
MHGYDILHEIELILGVSALVVFVLFRLKIPSLVGFIVAGVLIGPGGLGLIEKVSDVEFLAEIGVVLLLFVIGIEFSLANLMRMKKLIFGGGSVQMVLTIAVTAAVTYPMLASLRYSVFFGFLVALSSTAIVLKMLSERGEIDSPHGKMMVGILIFQDLCVVPLMLITPVLAGNAFGVSELIQRMGKAGLIVVVVLVTARWVVPRLLHQVVHTKSRELFVTSIIMLCLGIALLTAKFGLSLALGAFLAGLVISESEYAHQAMSDILPFKDTFIGLFFVSVGMLMDVGYIGTHVLKVSLMVAIIFCIKVLTGTVASLLSGRHLRTAVHTGFGLAQVGEFSFVLAGGGRVAGLITGDVYQIFLSASLVTMLVTPFVLKRASGMSDWASSMARRIRRLKVLTERSESGALPKTRADHVVIVGFGINGRNLARVLRESEIPYVVLELNSDVVRRMHRRGEPIYYGDGSSVEMLHKMGIRSARVLVVAISDAASTRKTVHAARLENPNLYIIVRTRYLAEMDDLRKLGASEVIPEEFETSVEIFSRVLHHFAVPRNVINDYVDSIRQDNYRILRRIELPRKRLFEHENVLAGIETESFLLK